MIEKISVNVSRETMADLRTFEAMTAKWTAKINLIAKSTVPEIWNRHIVDSAQIFQYASSPKHWVDIGSGGGFPGIVVAIMAKELSPETKFTLIESDARKCTFLRTAIRELKLNAYVITQRIEKTAPQGADIVSARALGSLTDLIPHLQRHLLDDGVALLMKGRTYNEELAAVSADWHFELDQYPSITDSDSRILSLKRITRAA